jgi:hypothetical protein
VSGLPNTPLTALYGQLAACDDEVPLALVDAISAATAAAISEHMCPHCSGRLWPFGDGASCQDCHTIWHPPTPPGTMWQASGGMPSFICNWPIPEERRP